MIKLNSLIYKICLLICGIVGLTWNIMMKVHPTTLEYWGYYTYLSNLAVCVAMVFSIIAIIRNRKPSHELTLWTTVIITLTLLIYHFALRPGYQAKGYNILHGANLFVHYIVSLGMIADYIFFDEDKGSLKWFKPLYWIAFPLGYYLWINIYVWCGGRFTTWLPAENQYEYTKVPYWFLNYEVMGWSKVIFVIFAFVAGFLVLSYIFWGLDKAIPLYKKHLTNKSK